MKKGYGENVRIAGYFEFGPLVIQRTPLLSYCEWKCSTQQLLDRPEFRAAIQNASTSLYNELKKKFFRFDLLSQKEKNSVIKYHNRICFRPTPFGIMAGFSVLKWNAGSLLVPSINDCIVHLLPDFGTLEAIYNKFTVSNPPRFCYANPTIYKAGNEYRFIIAKKEQGQERRYFSVDSIAFSDWMNSLLQYCKRPILIFELASILSKILGQHFDYSLDVLMQLLDVQVLLPEGLPNITGRDFSLQLNSVGLKIAQLDSGKYSIPDLNGSLMRSQNNAVYLNLERPVLNGGACEDVKKDIMDGLKVGRLMIPCREVASLEKFRKRFVEKFDQRPIPLMEALDPELGIGYEDLLKMPNGSALTDCVQWNDSSISEQSIVWSDVTKFLINKLGSGKRTIQLEEKDITFLEDSIDKNERCFDAPGISVVFRRCFDGKTYIESAGGVSPMNLIGRFTPLHNEIAFQAQTLAKMESSENPGVIFAEIVHYSDSHVANIERRNAIRDFEIPILVGSGVEKDHRIAVSDLFIAVRNNEIILWSKRLKKRIIPRLDSAYNHSISDLPVFRFLCDLQGQGLQTSFSFCLKDFFPGLKHYPRIEYKNTVLSLEEWYIGKEDWREIIQMQQEAVRNWLEQQGLPKLFAITNADRQIIIDRSQDKDIELLCSIYKDKIPEGIVVREFPFVGLSTEKGIVDVFGNQYIGQFIAQLYNRQEIYRPIDAAIFEEDAKELPKRTNYPQDGWLYYKIYCHEGSANKIIGDYIFPLSTEMEDNTKINKWFFIRYNENGYHIRLRFLVKDGCLQEVMDKFHQTFLPLVTTGTVSKILMAPYERELERYGHNIINTETFFHLDSRLTAAYFHYCHRTFDQPEYYELISLSINALTDKMGMNLKEKVLFHEQCYEGLRTEQQQHSEIYRQLQQVFRKFRSVMSLQKFSLDSNGRFEEELGRFKVGLDTLDFSKTLPDVFSILPSLVHLQLNRILVSDFHRQEMVVHYILWKYHLSVLHRTSTVAGAMDGETINSL